MASDTLRPGFALASRYRLLRPLGAGAMGAVWEAHDTAAARTVAVKLMTEHAPSAEVLKRFELEASAARIINHPSIVEVLDSGTTPWGAPFLVMEHLGGLSLRAFIDEVGQLTPGQACAVMAPVLEGLAAAHSAGVVHRDIKPENIFLSVRPRDAVKLLDFGISRFADAGLTQTGMAFGTPAYMAPEQVRDVRTAGPTADVYAVGAVLFELMAGRTLFEGDNALSVAARVLTEEPPSLASVRGDLSPAVTAVVSRALAKDPSLRFPDAVAFLDALAAAARPEREWLFESVHTLSPAPTTMPPAPSPLSWQTPRAGAQEVTLASLLQRLQGEGRRLAAPVAVRLVADLLRRADAPPSTSPSFIFLDDAGVPRAVSPSGPPAIQLGALWRTWAAPEVGLGQTPAAASLQYSLAVVLLEALTGTPLLTAPSREALVALARQPVALPALGGSAPRDLVKVLTRMLKVDPGQRYATNAGCAEALASCFQAAPAAWARAAEVRAALVREGRPTGLSGPLEPVPDRPSRWPFALAVTVLLAVGLPVALLRRATPVVVEEPSVPTLPVDAEPTQGLPDTPLVETKPAPDVPAVVATYHLTTTPPGAAIELDGERVGLSPGRLSLPVGRSYQLKLTLPGHLPHSATVTPREDQLKVPLSVTLERSGAPLAIAFVKSTPEDAEIRVDGVAVGRTPAEVPVEAGRSHLLEVVFSSGQRSKQDITLEENERRSFEARATP